MATQNLATGNGLSLKGWDPFQFAVATATSAGAGAVCGVTLGLGCAAASVAASEIQYQVAPGSKSPLGYLGAGVIGGITASAGGGSVVDEGPLHWDENLVGRMAATFGLDWERKFASQAARSAVTSWLGGATDYAWNSIIGDSAKDR